MNNILITGCAGFIGFHLSNELCKRGYNVVGIDNLNEYYDVSLKKNCLNKIKKHNNFKFYQIDITHNNELKNIQNQIVLICLMQLILNLKFQLKLA